MQAYDSIKFCRCSSLQSQSESYESSRLQVCAWWLDIYLVICRNVLSSAYSQGRRPDPNWQGFKTLGMLLKMGYVPEYAAKIVVILDDRPEVWKVSSDRKLVHPISPQQLVTSDGKLSTERALAKFASVACELSSRAFAQQQMDLDLMKSLAEVEKDVALARFHRDYRRH